MNKQNHTELKELPNMTTIQKAAKATGLSMHFIRQLCVQNKIVTVSINRKYFINVNSLNEYLSQTQKMDF